MGGFTAPPVEYNPEDWEGDLYSSDIEDQRQAILEAEQTRRANDPARTAIRRGGAFARNYVAPAMGAIAGGAATTALFPRAGAGALPIGSAVGAGVTNLMLQGLDKVVGHVTDNETSPLSWADALRATGEGFIGGGMGGTIEGLLAKRAQQAGIGGINTRLRSPIPGQSSRFQLPEVAFLSTGRYTPAQMSGMGSLPAELPKFNASGVPFVNRRYTPIIPQHMQEARQGAQLMERVETGAGANPYGSAGRANPADLSSRLRGNIVRERMALKDAARERGYSRVDMVLRHPNNVAPPESVEIGEKMVEAGVDADGNIIWGIQKIFNEYPIESPFDMRPYIGAFEKMKHDAALRRLPADGRVMKFLDQLTDPNRDWYVPLDVAYSDYSQMVKLATPAAGKGATPIQREAAKIAAQMKKYLDEALEDYAQQAEMVKDPKIVKRWQEQGRKTWGGMKQLYEGESGTRIARTLRSQNIKTILGKNDSNAHQIHLMIKQLGRSGTSNLWKAHWTQSIMEAKRGKTIDPEAFDKLINRPGNFTMDTLIARLPKGNMVAPIGTQAVRNAASQMHEHILLNQDYGLWFRLSPRTRNIMAGGDRELLFDLNSFYQQMVDSTEAAIAQGKDPAIKVAKTLEAVIPAISRMATPPGKTGVKRRWVITMLGRLLSGTMGRHNVRTFLDALKGSPARMAVPATMASRQGIHDIVVKWKDSPTTEEGTPLLDLSPEELEY